jgi:hypothetical protein
MSINLGTELLIFIARQGVTTTKACKACFAGKNSYMEARSVYNKINDLALFRYVTVKRGIIEITELGLKIAQEKGFEPVKPPEIL